MATSYITQNTINSYITTASTTTNWYPIASSLTGGSGYAGNILVEREAYIPSVQKFELGQVRAVHLPDGAVLNVAADGSYKLEDADAKIIYKACRIRDFNPYLNASDLLEQFIKRVGEDGVAKDEFMGLPIELFIKWVILRAAQQDRDDEVQFKEEFERSLHQVLLPAPTPRHRHCLVTGRFIPPSRPVPYASRAAMIKHARSIDW